MVRFANFPNGRPVREPKVFICYRRLDSKAHVGRLRDRLHVTLGPDSAFLDKDNLLPGGEFPEEITETIKTVDALLVVIGPNWLNDENRRRLHEPNDFVRQEITVGLRSEGVKVIPVLVDGGEMPRADELPEDIQALTRRTAIKLSDDHWDYDTQRLVDVLRGLVPREHAPPSERFKRAARALAGRRVFFAALLAVVAAALALFAFRYIYRPLTLDECLRGRARAMGIPPERVLELSAGAFDHTIIETGRAKEGTFLLKLTDSGRELGAVALNYSPVTENFKVEAVVGPDCADNRLRYGNEDRPGVRDTLRNWDKLLVRFREEDGRPYRLRIGSHNGGIRASFNVALDPRFLP